MKIEIFATNEDVADKFGISRDDRLAEDEYQERCDDIEMAPDDNVIANIEKDGYECELSTTSGKWNVYAIFSKYGYCCEVINMTCESEEWETVTDIAMYLINAVESWEAECK